jgi:hypothetical protein
MASAHGSGMQTFKQPIADFSGEKLAANSRRWQYFLIP